MDPTMMFVIVIMELVMKHGIPGVIKIIKLWNVEEPTLEDIQALRNLVKPPEMYFTDDDS
jgi:hypothetical protein